MSCDMDMLPGLVHVPHVSLLGLQDARLVDLLELELDRLWVCLVDGPHHVLARLEGRSLAPTGEEDEDGVSVAVHDLG